MGNVMTCLNKRSWKSKQ